MVTRFLCGDTHRLPIRKLWSGESYLLGIPVSDASRITLRIYDSFRKGGAVLVELVSADGNTTFAATEIVLTVPSTAVFPALATLSDLREVFPELQQQERIHLKITPLTQGMRYYPLLSVTDNDTQHVLLVTPE